MRPKHFPVFIEEQAIDIVAKVRNAGENLIFFVHGLGCSKDSFHHFWNYAEFNEYSVLAIDLAGFGESSNSNNFSHTMEAQAKICSKILTNFSYKNLYIVAHSMGGAVALLLPDEILNLTKTFINIEGNLISADCGIISQQIISMSQAEFESHLLPKLRNTFNRLGENYTAIDSSSANSLYKSSKSLVAWSNNNKLLDKFLGLNCRKAYFFGDKNADLPVLNLIGDIQKVMIKNSGHFPMNDNPKSFYHELYKFLQHACKT
ncbi:MAG: alpha/beta fold hydrolase [Desulfobacula sp.]|jgi:pimeloyl-ACP methyl ester carboxylesterase|nr:alpha/beta fold hydrolase [Desulfobacula sp.]MBT6338632.1 alpha/beta fold hydrolase [Desulfobacula sp.]MBT7259885.1 alpha/beta fold hydrolase [Desulfobacula sp.]